MPDLNISAVFGCVGCPYDDPDYGCMASTARQCYLSFVYPAQLPEEVRYVD